MADLKGGSTVGGYSITHTGNIIDHLEMATPLTAEKIAEWNATEENLKEWAKSFGLGSDVTTGINWNDTSLQSGLYAGSTNSPSAVSGNVYGLHINRSNNNYVFQIVGRNGRTWFRTRENGTWGSWIEVETTAGSQAKADAAESAAKAASVPTGRTITAGNGLSGGGNLTANRTIALGTPGTLTPSTTNSVTATSHTHDIATATQAEAQAGTINTKFMTPLRVKEAITALAPTPPVTSVAGKTGAVTLAGTDIPAATTGARGTVQLSTSTSSTSTTLAATASAVKAAYDLANGRAPASHTHTPAQVGLGNVTNVKQMPISGGVLENYTEKMVTLPASGTVTLSLNDGNVFYQEPTGTTTFRVTGNRLDVGQSFTLFLDVFRPNLSFIFPVQFKWLNGSAPDLTKVGTYVFTFTGISGGFAWFGSGGIFE